jgi:chaperonin GroEL
LVIIAEDVDGEALTTLVVNKLRGAFSVLAIKAPGYGDKKKEILSDIAVTIGATVVSSDIGIKLENADISLLGRARKVISKKDNTIIVGGKGKKASIDERVAQIKKQRDNTDSKYEKEKLDERIAKLSLGVAVIRVGAATETEMKYLKLKIEDAVNATKAAIEEGIVPGGGVALIKSSVEITKNLSQKKNITKENELGYNIVIKALEAPLKQIAMNVGKEDGSVIVDKVKNGKGNYGYDALKDEFVSDMIASGIVDPVKVTRLGVENACSAASILLTTEVAVAEEPKDDKSSNQNQASDMGY